MANGLCRFVIEFLGETHDHKIKHKARARRAYHARNYPWTYEVRSTPHHTRHITTQSLRGVVVECRPPARARGVRSRDVRPPERGEGGVPRKPSRSEWIRAFVVRGANAKIGRKHGQVRRRFGPALHASWSPLLLFSMSRRAASALGGLPLSLARGRVSRRAKTPSTSHDELLHQLRRKSWQLNDLERHPVCYGVPLGQDGGPSKAVSVDCGLKSPSILVPQLGAALTDALRERQLRLSQRLSRIVGVHIHLDDAMRERLVSLRA